MLGGRFVWLAVLLACLPLSVRAEEYLQQVLHDLQSGQPALLESSLRRLQAANLQPLGLPCNDLTCHTGRLDVVNMDALLLALGKLWQQQPAYRARIERLLLRWNYCEVNYDNRPHNLNLQASGVKRQAVDRVRGWPGMALWGFTEQDPEGWLRPQLLTDSALDAQAKRQLVYRVTRKQCFPNPWDGYTVYDPEPSPYQTAYRKEPNESVLFLQDKPEPLQEKPKKVEKKTPKKKSTTAKNKKRKRHAMRGQHVVKNKKLAQLAAQYWRQAHPTGGGASRVKPTRMSMSENLLHPTEYPKPSSDRLHSGSLKMAVELSPQAQTPALHLAEYLPTRTELADVFQEQALTQLDSSPFLMFPQDQSWIYGNDQLPPPGMPNTALAGDIQLRWRLKDNTYALTANAQWSPYKHWYIQGGLRQPVTGLSRVPTYTWGLGYNNWKKGGWSLGVNQWNAQTLKTPPRLKNMEWKLGYNLSVPKLFPLSRRFQSNIALSIYQGVPTLSNTWQYNVGDGWYVRGGVGKQFARNKPYHQNDWGWTYGFGRAKWQAGSLNIEYANWGFNRIPQANFRQNGEVILTWRWKLPWS